MVKNKLLRKVLNNQNSIEYKNLNLSELRSSATLWNSVVEKKTPKTETYSRVTKSASEIENDY